MKPEKVTWLVSLSLLPLILSSCSTPANPSSSSSSSGSESSSSSSSSIETSTPEEISISIKAEKSLKVGESYQIRYELSEAGHEVAFNSADPSIASVSADGLVTGVSVGSTKILAYLKGRPEISDAMEVTVEAAEIKEKQTYGFYVLKDGVTDLSFLEGYPWLNTSVQGVLGKIEKPSAKDDFFAFANYESLSDYLIPEGKEKGGGLLYQGRELSDERIKTLISEENSTLSTARQMFLVGAKEAVASDISKSFSMSEDELFAFFKSKEMLSTLTSCLSIESMEGVPTIDFSSSINNPSWLVVIKLAKAFEKMDELVKGVMDLAEGEGVSLPSDFKENFEKLLDDLFTAYTSATPAQNSYLKTTVGELDTLYKDKIDLKSALKQIGFKDSDPISYNAKTVSFCEKLSQFDVASLRVLLAASKAASYSNFIGAEEYLTLYREKLKDCFAFSDSSITDSTTPEEYASSCVESMMAEALCKRYVEKYVTESSREKIANLIEDIIAKYRVLLSQNDWLTQTTKNRAIEKLDAMTYVPFYEDGLMDIATFSSDAKDIISFTGDYADYLFYEMSRSKVDTNTLRQMTPYTGNAAYIPSLNRFVITHGLVATFIDDPDLTDEFLYGTIGMATGHEISHGFDSNGSMYDKNGDYTDWWESQDKAAFKQKVQKMVDYCNNDIRAFRDEALDGNKLNGEITADMGGLKVATLMGEDLNNFDFKEMYRASAEFFGFVYTYDSAKKAKATDPHPLSYLRVNVTCAQLDRFLQTFDVKEGDGMYIAPEKRVAIW